MTPEIEALRLEVATLKAASSAADRALTEATVRLEWLEAAAKKAAFVAHRPDAVNIGGHWVAGLDRDGPRKVTGWILERGNYGWRWDGRRSLMTVMHTDEDRAALLAAAGEWRS